MQGRPGRGRGGRGGGGGGGGEGEGRRDSTTSGLRGPGRSRDRSHDTPESLAVGGFHVKGLQGPAARGKAETQVNFTVQVPFDIVEGMRCRAMYYGDETFNDATVLKRSRKGWLVSFVGYEDDKPQDTAVADILAIPVAQAAAPNSPASAVGGREGGGGDRKGQVGSSKRDEAGGHVKTEGGKGGRGKLGATTPLEGEVLQVGTTCRALFYGDQTYNPASLLKRTRRGWLVVFDGYEQEKPQDTSPDDILFPGWTECEALYYDENTMYPAYRGPQTTRGYLVGFVGFELDPCQDTLARDIVLAGRRREGRQPKNKPQAVAPAPANQRQQQEQGTKTQKERASDDCVVHVRNLDVLVTKVNLFTFCTKTVGYKPENIRMLATRPRGPEVAGEVPPKETIRAIIVFGTADEATAFCIKASGSRLKGRQPVFGIKIDGKMWHPSGGGGSSAGRAAQEAPGGVEHADDLEDAEGLDDTADEVGAGTSISDSHHSREVQFQLGALYDALLGGGGFLAGDTGASPQEGGGVHESLLSFGLCVSRMGVGGSPSSSAAAQYSLKGARAALHILKENGDTLRMGAGVSLDGRLLSKKSILAIALPVGCSLVESDMIQKDVLAALPALAQGRAELVFVDAMTAAAVEFVDGWYSNMYDSASMQLVLVHMHAHCVQIGLASVGPSYVDVIHTVETELCSERLLYEQVTALLAARVQQAVKATYDWEPPASSSWFPHGLGELEVLAPRIINEIGSKGEARIAYTYCPEGVDSVMMLDVCIAAQDLAHESGTCLGALVSAASQLMQELHEKDPAKFGKGVAAGAVLRGVAPVGPSCAGELLCRTLLSVIGAQKDNIHFFLRDPRNLAAGAARAALWITEGRCSVDGAVGDPGAGEVHGCEPSEEGKKELRNVVRRCRMAYMCSVKVSGLPTSSPEGLPERSPSPVTIPWNPCGNVLPANCAVNDLEDTNIGVQTFVISEARSGMVYARIPLADSDEVSVTIDTNGLLEAKRFYQGAPLPAEVSLAPHPCRFLAHKSTETEKEEADEGAEHETDLALLLSSLAPVLAK